MRDGETPSTRGEGIGRTTEGDDAVARVRSEERESVARELHDGVCQDLVAAACALEVARRKLAAREAAGADCVAKAAALVERALRDARSLARGREAVEVGSGGLAGALARLAEETEQVYGVTCGFAAVGPGAAGLGAGTAGHLYRIAQEAVSNAVRHGGARYVTVGLSTTADVVTLTVRDDGVGLGKGTCRRVGMGLGTMAYRARVIGGALEVRAAEGGGTVVECAAPVVGSESISAGR